MLDLRGNASLNPQLYVKFLLMNSNEGLICQHHSSFSRLLLLLNQSMKIIVKNYQKRVLAYLFILIRYNCINTDQPPVYLFINFKYELLTDHTHVRACMCACTRSLACTPPPPYIPYIQFLIHKGHGFINLNHWSLSNFLHLEKKEKHVNCSLLDLL